MQLENYICNVISTKQQNSVISNPNSYLPILSAIHVDK